MHPVRWGWQGRGTDVEATGSQIGATAILLVHLAWAVWMVSGVALAVAGFRWATLWRWRVFRIAHLIGLLLTATVPIWNRSTCPLTEWEWALAPSGAGDMEPFLARAIRAVLYIDLSPMVLSVITILGAVLTLVIFIQHPPGGRYASTTVPSSHDRHSP